MPSTLHDTTYSNYIRSHIRTVPDWPHAGVQFRDITPLLQDPKTFRVLVDIFVHRYMNQQIDLIAGLDARGFILGSVIAYELNVGFVPIRKKGKLPYTTIAEEYELEYGSATVEIHADACVPGQRVVVIDDLVALAQRHGLDGVHLTDGAKAVRYARKELGNDAIVGAFCGASRHDGMNAGEMGADYVAFGPAGTTALGTGERAGRMREQRAHALAATEHRVAHRLVQALRRHRGVG